jgi:hypothetical protein
MVYDIITKWCGYYFPSKLCLLYAIPFQTPKDMLWNPKVLWDTLKGVVHMNWIVLCMSNTLLITQTKIIEPMVFANYPKKGIVFFLGFGMAMQYPSKFQ